MVMINDSGFDAWFKDSKVVDDTGAPLIVFHGTAELFQVDEFAPSQYGGQPGGIFFTTDARVAEQFAVSAFEASGGIVRVVGVFLAVNNPKVIEAADFMDGEIHSFAREYAAVLKAKREGHDGMLIRGVPEHGGQRTDQWVVFSAAQISGATEMIHAQMTRGADRGGR